MIRGFKGSKLLLNHTLNNLLLSKDVTKKIPIQSSFSRNKRLDHFIGRKFLFNPVVWRLYSTQPHENHEPSTSEMKSHKPTEYKPVFSNNFNEKQHIDKVDGLIFGTRVKYIDPNVKETYGEDANGWLWGKRPRAPGEPIQWDAWEFPVYFTLLLCLILCIIYAWAKPETSAYVWAREEVIERRILKLRSELEGEQKK